MSLDLGSVPLEVAIALSFVFFLLSVIASACTEGISWALKWRATNLVKGIKGLVGETEGENILKHPLVKTDVTSNSKRKEPSYVSTRNFTLALFQTVGDGTLAAARNITEARTAIDKISSDSPLGAQLKALVDDGEADLAKFRNSVEKWFDDGMDRVSGWYKRRTQFVTCLLAVAIAVGLNVDAIRVGERIANDPTVRATIVKQAEQASAAEVEEGGGTSEGSIAKTGEKAEGAIDQLEALQIPILWGGDNQGVDLTTIAGWVITALAISLGAPFWFDALGKLARLRTTGTKPKPAKESDPE
ncbi:MAG TPA: hypothetical protein VFJ57_10970 [Solirubrobacterales bacterium]|nr:hypothetical protein [Solirubrobacterales bacterium]